MRFLDVLAARRHRQDPESGQAMVEFALILFPLLLIVAGIIQFGIALNYWLDMQRIANQGARWAAVDNWPPNCVRNSPPASCTGSNSLQQTLLNQTLTQGLRSGVTVVICYPGASATQGQPVRVRLTSPFKLLPILGVGSLGLGAEATMRLEQTPTHFTPGAC